MSGEQWSRDEELVKIFPDAERDELFQALALLARSELVATRREYWEGPPDHHYLMLTKRGFDVVRQRKLAERQEKQNESLISSH
jgi:hypothetical protein